LDSMLRGMPHLKRVGGLVQLTQHIWKNVTNSHAAFNFNK